MKQKISVPRRQAVHGGIGLLGPAVGNVAKEEGILEVLYFSCNGQLSLEQWREHVKGHWHSMYMWQSLVENVIFIS